MPPKFALQSVLDYRHSQVEALEIEFSRLVAARLEKEARMESLRSLHEDLCLQLYRSQQGEIDLFLVQHLQVTLNQVRDAAAQVYQESQELDKQKEAKRLEMVAAKQSEETLGILKAKEGERYRAEQAAQENRFQDDLYISRGFHQRQAD